MSPFYISWKGVDDVEKEKRMAGDYEIIHAVQIGDREIVVGENLTAEKGQKYMTAFCEQNDLFAHRGACQ